MLTTLLLTCAMNLGQVPDRAEWQLAPQLTPGLELVYSGVYLDETLIPNAQHLRQYRLDGYVLVLDAGVKDWHVAFMTGLSLQDPRQPLEKKAGPTSVQLEQARIDWQGRVQSLNKKPLDIPLHGPATTELGFIVPAPTTKVRRNFTWEITPPDRPVQRWHVDGTESCGGVLCIKLTGVQQSDDWDRGRADQTAWRRRDTIWLHPQFNVAQKVERIIEHRAPARNAATHRHVVRYELDSSLRYPGRAFEERKEEIAKASKFHEDAQVLLRQPVLNRALADSLIQRVTFHLQHRETQSATPYRKAIMQVKTVLEKAKMGDVPAPLASEEPGDRLVKTLDVGHRVPDFAVSSLVDDRTVHLKSFHGKPVLVLFYNPATQLGTEVIRYAKSLNDKNADSLGIMAMAVTNDAAVVRQQHQDLRLGFPVLDGNGLRQTLGVFQTPRFVVLDGDGVIRYVQTGWGYHMPGEITEILRRCQTK